MTQLEVSLAATLTGISVAAVRFEHYPDTLGIGVTRPRLSWMVDTAIPGWRQAGYELEAYEPVGSLCGRTGRVDSDQSVFVPWPFDSLSSREQVRVRVRVWGDDSMVSAWSALAPIEAGLLRPEDWTARFVTPDWDEDTSEPQPSPMLRREFAVHPGVERVRLYATAFGVYELELNGTVVGDHVLAPGWTSYHDRLRYQTFDVTGLVREGQNAIGAMLGDGWYEDGWASAVGVATSMGIAWRLLAQLEIMYADGTTERVDTDESWRAAQGAHPLQ